MAPGDVRNRVVVLEAFNCSDAMYEALLYLNSSIFLAVENVMEKRQLYML